MISPFRYLIALSAGMLMTQTAVAALTTPDKAEIIADVINSLSPKKEGEVTIVKAEHVGSKVTIHLVADSPRLASLTHDEIEKLTPIMAKAFKMGICSDKPQLAFIQEGGVLVYEMKINKVTQPIHVLASDCEDGNQSRVK
jgi:hypothetical protein